MAKKLDLAVINKFLRNNTGAKYFEKDKELFIKTLPNSKLIKDLDRVPDFRKKDLDERIVHEMLILEGACIDCIWENRGYYVHSSGAVKPLSEKPSESELTEIEKKLIELDFDSKAAFNIMKGLVFELKLDVKDNKKKTYIDALTPLKDKAIQKAKFLEEKKRLEEQGTQTPEGGNNKPSADAEANTEGNNENAPADVENTPAEGADASADAEKKSEGQEPNTQA